MRTLVPTGFAVRASLVEDAAQRAGAVTVVAAPFRPLQPQLAHAKPTLSDDARVAEAALVSTAARSARDSTHTSSCGLVAGEFGSTVGRVAAPRPPTAQRPL